MKDELLLLLFLNKVTSWQVVENASPHQIPKLYIIQNYQNNGVGGSQ
jgi:hypothetical protein